MLHAEFSAMDYTLNIVSRPKCRFFFIFKHSPAPKRSWKIFHGVLESPGKVLDFLSVKEWAPWLDSINYIRISSKKKSRFDISENVLLAPMWDSRVSRKDKSTIL